MKTALVLVDIQNDYFPKGKMELEDAGEAGHAAGRLLAAARRAGITVCHAQHISTRPGATFFLPETPGAAIHEDVRPLPGECVFVKHYPNSFRETELDAYLHQRDIGRLILAGMMSHMCIDATTRAAFDFGYECIVAHDACATRNLVWNGVAIPACHVHASIMSALGSVYARVASVDEIVAELEGD